MGLRGFCGLVFETVDESFDLLAFAVQIFLLCEKLFVAGFAVADVLIVIAWITGDDTAHDLHGDVRQGVEEIAVMGDEQQCSGKIAEKILKPFDSRNIEIVCRFVQEKDVRS